MWFKVSCYKVPTSAWAIINHPLARPQLQHDLQQNTKNKQNKLIAGNTKCNNLLHLKSNKTKQMHLATHKHAVKDRKQINIHTMAR